MSTLSKIGAVCEVGIVTFALVPFVTLGVYWLFPLFEKWQTDVLGFPFPVFVTSEVTMAWGFWTIFSGLVFGFVREKSGGILAPTLLHGLPQAIASVALLAL